MKKSIFWGRRSVIFRWLLSYISILIIPLLLSGFVYVISSRELENEINHANAAMLRQVQSDIDTRLLDMNRLAMQIGWNPRVKMLTADRTGSYPADEYNWVMRDFRVYRMSNSYIDTFYVYLKDKDAALTPGTLLQGALYESALARYSTADGVPLQNLLWQRHISRFLPVTEVVYGGGTKQLISLVQSLPVDNTTLINSTLVILLDSGRLLDSIRNMQWIERGVVLVLDEQDHILASTVPFDLPDQLRYANLSDPEKLFYFTGRTQDGDKTYTVAHTTSAVTGWKYVSITPNEIFWEKSDEVRRITLMAIFASLLFGLVLSGIFVRNNYSPVQKLVGTLSKDTGAHVDRHRSEFGFIEDTLGARRAKDCVLDRQLVHLRDSFIVRLLKNSFDSPALVQEALTLYGMHFDSGFFAVMIFYIRRIDDTALGGMGQSEQLRVARYSVRNVFEELLGQHHPAMVVKADDLQAALINVNSSRSDPAGDFIAATAEGQQFLLDHFGIELCVTVSMIKDTMEQIPDAYTEAFTAMEYNILHGTADLTFYSDIRLGLKEVSRTYYYYYPLQVEVQLTNFIKSGDYNNAKKILNNLFEVNFKQYSLPSLITRCFMYNLVSTIMKTIYEITGSSHSELAGENAVETLLNCQSVSEMDIELNKILIRLCEYTQERNAANNLIQSASNYIRRSYSDALLSIPMVAEQFDITPSYLSKRFKESTGIGLLDFISKTRVDAAKALLIGGEKNIHAIAALCGFVNSNTFIRTFKKYEGITPGKYREISQLEKEEANQ